MKIIKQGDKLRVRPLIRFECGRCGCVFECDETECEQKISCRNESYLGVKCPTCGNFVMTEVE